MKNGQTKHYFASRHGWKVAVVRCFFVSVVLTVSLSAFSLNEPDLTENLPFKFEFLSSPEHTIRLVTDTSASMHFCPTLGKVISPFGRRGGRSHTGVDVKLKRGDTVRAALKGVVKMASSYFGYGKLVVLKHPDGYETYYGHLSKCLVSKGDTVYAGQTVGLGGRTGRATTDHLHFEVRKNGSAQNPEQYFSFATGELKKHVLFGVKELFIASGMKTESIEAKVDDKPVVEVKPTDSYVTIQKGDTLYSLAKRYGKTVTQLQQLNRIEGSLLKIGMRIRIN